MADFQPAMDLYVFSGKLDSTMHFVSKKKWTFFVPCYQQKYSPLKLKYMVHLNIPSGDSYWEGDQPEM